MLYSDHFRLSNEYYIGFSKWLNKVIMAWTSRLYLKFIWGAWIQSFNTEISPVKFSSIKITWNNIKIKTVIRFKRCPNPEKLSFEDPHPPQSSMRRFLRPSTPFWTYKRRHCGTTAGIAMVPISFHNSGPQHQMARGNSHRKHQYGNVYQGPVIQLGR